MSLSRCREGEVRELERQVQETRDSVTQLQLERTELHTKAMPATLCMHTVFDVT